MRFCVLSSGSSGNATYVESNGAGILIDAGLSCGRLERSLGSIGRSLADVSSVLITHAHEDHTRALRLLERRCAVPVYAAVGVGEQLGCNVVLEGVALDFGGFSARFFPVPHDSPTCGVVVSGEGMEVAFATDLGEMPARTLEALKGVRALVLEANHDEAWLKGGPYPANLKRRILSASGHLSNEQAADVVCELASFGLTDVVLAHLSEKNNSPARAVGTVLRALRERGQDRVRVVASMRGRPTPWIEVGFSEVVNTRPTLFEV